VRASSKPVETNRRPVAQREGHRPEAGHLVGNVMIDTLLYYLDRASSLGTPQRLGLEAGAYADRSRKTEDR
jgi:hypothetical protein